MRYYIVDKYGNVCGDFEDKYTAKLKLESAYTDEQIKEDELEIIEGN